MNLKSIQILTGALITGLLSGTSALADEGANQPTGDTQQMNAGKDGCQGKSAKHKDSCKGQTKKKKKNKNGCGGKDGCGQMKDKKDGE